MTMHDLSGIPDFWARCRADTDFHTAQECRRTARVYLRDKAPGWRFVHRMELRRAIRFWQLYADTVRNYIK